VRTRGLNFRGLVSQSHIAVSLGGGVQRLTFVCARATDTIWVMGQLSGAQQFQQLSLEDQVRYIAINQQMARFARDHAVPIIFAPPLSRGGKINGASGSVSQPPATTIAAAPPVRRVCQAQPITP
jgi:hypothetical protein